MMGSWWPLITAGSGKVGKPVNDYSYAARLVVSILEMTDGYAQPARNHSGRHVEWHG
jgi:hypothetical protein